MGASPDRIRPAPRILCLLLAALFALGAAVQWNDPDPVPWMLAYGVAAGLAVAASRGRTWPVATAVFALAMAVWFLRLAPTLAGAPQEAFGSFRMHAASHEEPREAVGLALLAVWNGFLASRGWQQRRAAQADGAAGPR
jgi:hypothetical protein